MIFNSEANNSRCSEIVQSKIRFLSSVLVSFSEDCLDRESIYGLGAILTDIEREIAAKEPTPKYISVEPVST